MNTNVKLMKKNVVQTNGGITRNVNVSVKIVIYVKNIIETSKENMQKRLCKNRKHFANIMEYSSMTCDEIIESYHEKTKFIPRNFNQTKVV